MHGILTTQTHLLVICGLVGACSPVFSEADCSDTALQAVNSADGQIVATLVRRDCGATTAFANTGYLSEAKGKDESWGEKIYVLQGDKKITLAWSDSTLTIGGGPAGGSDVFLRRTEWASVQITSGDNRLWVLP